MKTPKKFIINLKNKIITEEMVELALYSLNKRAKNCRDKKKEYYHKGKNTGYSRYFDNVDRYKQKEKEYYLQKEFLLTKLFEPNCIHELISNRTNKVRYYDYEPEFNELFNEAIYINEYFDRQTGEFIKFIDIIETEKISHYFLYYKTSNYSFHIPTTETEVSQILKSKNIKKITMDNLVTEGKNIKELVSIQLIKKIIKLVESGDYVFKREVKSNCSNFKANKKIVNTSKSELNKIAI